MIMGALGNAAMGLNAMSNDLSTISQNIANLNTSGYKTVRTDFQTVLSEQIGSGNDGSTASPNGTTVFGVATSTQNLDDVQGAFDPTGNFSDIALNGQGFFAVAQPGINGAAPAAAAPTLFTRNGAFQEQPGANGQSFLVDQSGNFLLGFQGSNGVISPSGNPVPIFIPGPQTVIRNGVPTVVGQPAQATTQVSVGANISPDNRSSATDNESFSVTAIDSQSESHPIALDFSPVTTSTITTTSTDLSTSPATVTGPTTTTQVNSLPPNTWNLTFGTSESGATIGTQPTTTTTSTSSTSGSVTTNTSTSTTQGITVTFNPDGSIASPKTVNVSVTWADGQTSNVAIDISQLTQFGGSGQTVVNFTKSNGFQDGNLQSLSFDSNGVLQASYSNGNSEAIAQVAVARFPGPEQLNPVSGTLFQETQASGVPIVGTANSLGASVLGGNLEASTTDLGTEFSNMILAQKAYGLNAEVLTTANQMTQTASGLQT